MWPTKNNHWTCFRHPITSNNVQVINASISAWDSTSDGGHVEFWPFRVFKSQKYVQKWIPRPNFSLCTYITHVSSPFSFQVTEPPDTNMAAGRHVDFLRLPKDLRWAPYLVFFYTMWTTKNHHKKNFIRLVLVRPKKPIWRPDYEEYWVSSSQAWPV